MISSRTSPNATPITIKSGAHLPGTASCPCGTRGCFFSPFRFKTEPASGTAAHRLPLPSSLRRRSYVPTKKLEPDATGTTMRASYDETGIILAAYGAGSPRGQAVLDAFEERVQCLFPTLPIRWVFTSHCTGPRNGTMPDARSAEKAFRELADLGVIRLAMQPLQIIPGAEFETVLRTAASGQAGRRIRRTVLGLPLLSGGEAVPSLARCMAEYRPGLAPNEALLWVGHGSLHASQGYYDDLSHALERSHSPVSLGTLRPAPNFAAMAERLRAAGYTHILLAPFFSLLGRHAARDILGDGPESWKTRLEQEGFQVRTMQSGLLEQELFIGVWIERLHAALAGLGSLSYYTVKNEERACRGTIGK